MEAIQTTRLKTRPACPVCRMKLDGATGFGKPEPDSLTVCVYCGVFLSFTPTMDLRVLADREWTELSRETQDQLTNYLNLTRGFRHGQE